MGDTDWQESNLLLCDSIEGFAIHARHQYCSCKVNVVDIGSSPCSGSAEASYTHQKNVGPREWVQLDAD